MPRWKWMDRKFNFDFPTARMPDLLERWRGTPARLEERVRGLAPEILRKRDENGWSIQENIGHLIEMPCLPVQRLEQLLAGASELMAADVTNRKTHEADYNLRQADELLAAFRRLRADAVDRFERLADYEWELAGLHRRLGVQMRVVDIVYFDCEHDDYHLARIGELIRRFAS